MYNIKESYNDLTAQSKERLEKNLHYLVEGNVKTYIEQIAELKGGNIPLWQALSHIYNPLTGYFGDKSGLTEDFFERIGKIFYIYKMNATVMYNTYGHKKIKKIKKSKQTEEPAQEVRTYNIKIICGTESLKILIDVLDRSNLLSYLEISKEQK